MATARNPAPVTALCGKSASSVAAIFLNPTDMHSTFKSCTLQHSLTRMGDQFDWRRHIYYTL